MRYFISMSADSVKHFVELIIATTIGSIVGAYIARDIQFSLSLFVRALFATALLAIFFFFIWQFSTHIGKQKKAAGPLHHAERYRKEPEKGAEEPYDEEDEPYEEYDSKTEYEPGDEADLEEDIEELKRDYQ